MASACSHFGDRFRRSRPCNRRAPGFQIVVIECGGRPQGHGSADQFRGEIRATGFESDQAGEIQRIGILRRNGQDLPINPFGIRQSSHAVILHRHVHGLLDGHRPEFPSSSRYLRRADFCKFRPPCLVRTAPAQSAADYFAKFYRRLLSGNRTREASWMRNQLSQGGSELLTERRTMSTQRFLLYLEQHGGAFHAEARR